MELPGRVTGTSGIEESNGAITMVSTNLSPFMLFWKMIAFYRLNISKSVNMESRNSPVSSGYKPLIDPFLSKIHHAI